MEKKIKIEEELEQSKKIIALLNETFNKKENKIKYDLTHLVKDSQFVFGPIQDDEALFLFGIVKAIRPKIVVEFGFSYGFSSMNFLKALDNDEKTRLFSYDIKNLNTKAFAHTDKRFKFYLKSQAEFNTSDILNMPIDIVYFDNGHHFDVNVEAFQRVMNQISPTGLIIVHDTGLHLNETKQCSCDFEGYCGGAHQIDERIFINWIYDNYPEWQIIQFHSLNIYRHGFTILQKKYKLGVKLADKMKCQI